VSRPRSRLAGPWRYVLPANWQSVQLRRIATFKNGADYKDVETESGGYPVYGSGGEFRRASSFLYDGESVLFGRKGTVDRPLLVRGRFWTVDTMFFTELEPTVDPRYLHYCAVTMPFDYYRTNTAVPSMTQNDLASHVIPLPSIEEQRGIADYLDRETAQIDTLIAKQEQLIATLRERRNAGLAELVWREGSPTVPLKFAARFVAGATPDTDDLTYWADPGSPDSVHWVAIGDMSSRDDVWSTKKSLTTAGVASRRLTPQAPGTVLFAMYASVGEVAILRVEAVWNQAILGIVVDTNKLDAEYLSIVLKSLQPQILADVRSNTQSNLNASQVSNITIPLPPLASQVEIAQRAALATSRIDALVTKANELITLAKERRSALIAAAVTGQIDVRTAA